MLKPIPAARECSKKFVQQGRVLLGSSSRKANPLCCSRGVLTIREHGKMARTPPCLPHPERWLIWFQHSLKDKFDQDYFPAILKQVEQYGKKLLAASEKQQVVEGIWLRGRTVLWEFPDVETVNVVAVRGLCFS
jgi:uncharacterized protein DUF1330